MDELLCITFRRAYRLCGVLNQYFGMNLSLSEESLRLGRLTSVCKCDSINLKLCDACNQAGPDSVSVGFVRSTVLSVVCDLNRFC